MRVEGADLERRFAEALRAGLPPDAPAVMTIAEGHRQHVSRRFDHCPPEAHAWLAELYVQDERFRAHEDRLPGLAEDVSAAVRANAAGR